MVLPVFACWFWVYAQFYGNWMLKRKIFCIRLREIAQFWELFTFWKREKSLEKVIADKQTFKAYFWRKGIVFSEIRDFPVATFVTTLQHHFVNAVRRPLSPWLVTAILNTFITSPEVVIKLVCKYLVWHFCISRKWQNWSCCWINSVIKIMLRFDNCVVKLLWVFFYLLTP